MPITWRGMAEEPCVVTEKPEAKNGFTVILYTPFIENVGPSFLVFKMLLLVAIHWHFTN